MDDANNNLSNWEVIRNFVFHLNFYFTLKTNEIKNIFFIHFWK